MTILCQHCGEDVVVAANVRWVRCPACNGKLNVGEQVQTIEQTGKFWKLQMLLSYIPFVPGFFIAAIGLFVFQNRAAIIAGVALMAIGFAWNTTARVCAWWHHG